MALIRKQQDKDQNGKKPSARVEDGVAKKETAKKIVAKNVKKQAVVKKDAVNRFEQIKKYFRGVYSEMKKVHWPTRREIITYTWVVLVAVAFVAVLIWIFDSVMGRAVQLIIR